MDQVEEGHSSSGFETSLDHAHQAVESEANDANGQDAKDDVGVVKCVVFLPEKSADTGPPGKHFSRDNNQPGDTKAQAKAGEHVRQGGGDQHFEERLTAREL